jgi:hypothetical protein
VNELEVESEECGLANKLYIATVAYGMRLPDEFMAVSLDSRQANRQAIVSIYETCTLLLNNKTIKGN